MAATTTRFDPVQFDGPRPMRMHEVVDSARLFQICFGLPELGSERGILAGYVPPREGGTYVIAHDGKLVTQIATFHDRIKVYDGVIRAGSVGGVCTHPEYRERRLAGGLLEYCAQELVDGGANLLLISGGRGLYTRLGNVPHGRFFNYTAGPKPPGDRRPLRGGLSVRRANSADAWACSRLYAAEPVHFVREHENFAEALRDPSESSYLYSDRWIVERAGEAIAYFLLGCPHGVDPGEGIRYVSDYAGRRMALADAFESIVQANGLQELTWQVAWQEGELRQELQQRGHEATVGPLYGHTLRIINLPAFMADLQPLLRALVPADLLRGLRFVQSGPLLGGLGEDRYAIERGPDRLELDGAAMTRLVMGSAEAEDEPVQLPGALAEVIPAVFPLPSFLPGLNYH